MAAGDRLSPPGPSARKLIGLGVASAAVALMLAAVAITAYDQITFRATKLENVTAVAAIVGHNAAAALAFDDAASGAKILSGLRAKPSIARASLYRRDGTVFATYTRSDVPRAVHAAAGAARPGGVRRRAAEALSPDRARRRTDRARSISSPISPNCAPGWSASSPFSSSSWWRRRVSRCSCRRGCNGSFPGRSWSSARWPGASRAARTTRCGRPRGRPTRLGT